MVIPVEPEIILSPHTLKVELNELKMFYIQKSGAEVPICLHYN